MRSRQAPAQWARQAMSESLLSGRNTTALLALLTAILVALISTGQIQVPLPSPAHGKVVNVVPEDVLPWRPQHLQGAFAANNRLHNAVRLFEGVVIGAESVAVKPDGSLALLDRYGNLFEATHSRKASAGDSRSSSSSWTLQQEPVARLGPGRPLGYHVDHQGNLIVCDSLKGLVKYDYSSRQVSILATHVSATSPIDPGSQITYANDLAIASDGKVYFTSCTDIVPALNQAGYYDTFRAWMLGLAQGLAKGRLLRFDPATKETVVLAKGFYYANGVALSQDESYAVLAETDRIRLLKVWLKGPKAGTTEPLIQHLPGAPDGVSTSSDGNFWVSLVSPVPPIARLLRDPTVRAVYAWLPDWLRPPLKKWGAVMKVSGDTGEVLDWLMDPTGSHISSVSAALEHNGKLFLGNLAGDYVSYVDLEMDKQQQQQQQQQQDGHNVDGEAKREAGAKKAKKSGFVVLADAAAADAAAAAEQPTELCHTDSTHGACANPAAVEEPDDSSDDAGNLDQEAEPNMPDADRALLYIHGKVHLNKVVVFSKSYCPFCRKAKNALLKFLKPEQLTVVELDLLHELPEGDEGRTIPADVIQDALETVTGRRTVPRVFIGGSFVGGGDDMESMAQTGRLKSVLAEQGLIAEE